MTLPKNLDDSDLGIEFFDEIASKIPDTEEDGFLNKAAKIGVFGAAGTPEGLRHVSRTGARIGETLLGLPGDIQGLLGDILVGIPEYFSGEELPRWRQVVKGSSDDSPLGLRLPTSGQLRGVTQTLSGKDLEPQNKFEEFADMVAEDFSALALPIKGKIPFARSLGQSILANTGGEIAKSFLGDKAKAYTKMGLLFATGMLGARQGGSKQYIRNLYKDMEASVPQGAEVSAKDLSKKLNEIESVLKRGDLASASKQPALQKINAIRSKVGNGGSISVDELIQLTKDTNESIFSLGELKRGEHHLYNIREALHETTKKYGSQNPTFLDKWKNANEAYAATEVSRKVGNLVKKNIKPKDYIYAASALGIGELTAFGPKAILPTIGLGAAAGTTALSAEILKRIAQSPSLRKYYTNVVTSSLKENKTGFFRAIKQLDSGLRDSFEEDPYETVEFED